MNQVHNNDKDRVMKTLAIVGFIAVIAFGVWLAVQIVSLVPNAFSSLASIADSVYNYQPSEETVDQEGPIFGNDDDTGVVLTSEAFPEDDTAVETEVVEVETDTTDYTEPATVVTNTPAASVPSTSYVPQEPRFIETITYSVPTSDPKGYVDLATKIVAVGHLTTKGDFVAGANMDNDTRGAFQFEVRNIGTKTSDKWDFAAKLTSGKTYNAPTQLPLKPQERVVFTIGYDNVGEDGINLIGVTVKSDEDKKNENDSFTWAVSVVE